MEGKDTVRERIANEFGISDKIIKDAFFIIKDKLLDKYKASSDAEIRDYMKLISDSKQVGVYYYEPHHTDEMREVFYDEEKDLYYAFLKIRECIFPGNIMGINMLMVKDI